MYVHMKEMGPLLVPSNTIRLPSWYCIIKLIQFDEYELDPVHVLF